MATFQTSIDTAEKMANDSHARWQDRNAQADTAQGAYKGWMDNEMPNRQALQNEADAKYDVTGAQNAYKTARDNVARVQTAMATLPEIERSMSRGLSAAQAGALLGQNTNRYTTSLAQLLPSAQLTSEDYNMATSLANQMASNNYSAGMDRGTLMNDFWKTLMTDANSAYGANQTDRGLLDSAIAAQAADANEKAAIDVEKANMAAYFDQLIGGDGTIDMADTIDGITVPKNGAISLSDAQSSLGIPIERSVQGNGNWGTRFGGNSVALSELMAMLGYAQ